MFAAALHPLQSCPDVETAVRHLPGSAWGVTASDEVRKWARDLVATDLQGSPVAVAESDRALWHAAAVTTANGITALLSLAEAMLSEIGVGHPGVVLGPLATGVVANTATRGAAATLTGPVVRGEARTIRSHIEALRTSAPRLLDSYRLVAHTILGAAISAGRIDPATAGSIRAELEG
jgi:predicted short-subunit dehydrogenase-like oxidoreductase (DUF2520 family)